jgi:hypothetical protein
MDLRVVGQEGVDWIHLAQGQVMGFCEHDNEPLVPYIMEYFLTKGTVSFSRIYSYGSIIDVHTKFCESLLLCFKSWNRDTDIVVIS